MKEKFDDIEQLSREMPYDLPDGFFREMQKNVMSRLPEQESKPRGRVIALRFAGAVAASLALVFGLLFFGNGGGEKLPAEPASVASYAERPSATDQPATVMVEDEIPEPVHENTTAHLTPAVKSHPKKNNSRSRLAVLKAEENLEKSLSSFSREELAELSHRYEQDTYLDLY
ncbi:MAG: hypothetical protein EAS48_01555 [Chryseobacterium sp.]|nr:MAG: hypothetical protein EAS48_01555 [Chryseobacterium sp.]